MSKMLSQLSVPCQVILLVSLLFLLNVHTSSGRPDSLTYNKVTINKRSAFPERRLDCDLFCRRTGFAGSVGGCQCGYTLFNIKRSDDSTDYTDEPWLNWINLRRRKLLEKYRRQH